MKRTIAILLCLAAAMLHAQKGRVHTWHHELSQYRAFFTLKQPGNTPKAGAIISVPVCGTARKGLPWKRYRAR